MHKRFLDFWRSSISILLHRTNLIPESWLLSWFGCALRKSRSRAGRLFHSFMRGPYKYDVHNFSQAQSPLTLCHLVRFHVAPFFSTFLHHAKYRLCILMLVWCVLGHETSYSINFSICNFLCKHFLGLMCMYVHVHSISAACPMHGCKRECASYKSCVDADATTAFGK